MINRRKLIICILILGFILMISYGVTYARYASNSIWNYYLESKGFYFTSKELENKRIKNNWDGSKVYFQNAQTVFGQDLSTYFAVSKLNNIPDTAVSQSVRVTPYWLPLGANDEDKNYVEGVSRTFSIQTFFDNAHDSTTIKEGE